MKIKTAVSVAQSILSNNPQQPLMFWGPPGCGKSYLCMHTLPDALNVPKEARFMFRPSNHDPVDLSGLPYTDGNVTRWITPEFLKRINEAAEKYGIAVITYDEFNQSVPMMFNAINGLLLDRVLAEFTLDPRVIQLCTGNRQSDKAASNRMPSHTANRLWHCDIESDLPGFIQHALSTGNFATWMLAYLNLHPQHLNSFDPDKRENATERVWEMCAKALGKMPQPEMVMPVAEGFVGNGIAATLAAFYKLYDEMPDPDAVLLDPKGYPVPEKLDVRYALASALADHADVNNFDRVITFVDRYNQSEMSVFTVRAAMQRDPKLAHTKAFIEFSVKHAGAF